MLLEIAYQWALFFMDCPNNKIQDTGISIQENHSSYMYHVSIYFCFLLYHDTIELQVNCHADIRRLLIR